MNLILSIVTVIISIVGAVVLWLAFLDDDLNWVNGGIWFACMVIPGIINDMYEDNLRTKYEYPNRKKEIIFEGTTYKKNTFQADYKFKGYVPCLIIIFIGALPALWKVIPQLLAIVLTGITNLFPFSLF